MKHIFVIGVGMLVASFTAFADQTQNQIGSEDTMKTIYQQTLQDDNAKVLGPLLDGYDTSERRLSLLTAGRKTLAVVERPFIPNPAAADGIGGGLPFKSSVPVGDYDLVLRVSPKHGEQWHFVNEDLHVYLELHDCPDIDAATGLPTVSRFSCMYHVANYVRNVDGCGGVGERIANFGGTDGLGVASSASGMLALKRYLEGETSARLRIT